MACLSGRGQGSPPCSTTSSAGAENAARTSAGRFSSWRNMVGTMIVEVTSRWSSASTVAASKRSTMRSVQPADIWESENASGAPWNSADTLRWRPWSGRRMTSFMPASAANISANGLPLSTKRCTPLGRPVVPDVYDIRQPPTS